MTPLSRLGYAETNRDRRSRFLDSLLLSETNVGMIGVLWGVHTLLSTIVWRHNELTSAMTDIAPLNVWGLVLILLGAMQLLAVWHDKWLARRASALFAAGFYGFISIAVWHEQLFAPSILIGPYYMVSMMVAYWRLGIERIDHQQLQTFHEAETPSGR